MVDLSKLTRRTLPEVLPAAMLERDRERSDVERIVCLREDFPGAGNACNISNDVGDTGLALIRSSIDGLMNFGSGRGARPSTCRKAR